MASLAKPIKSSLECVQIAWAKQLRDFRQWCKPEGQAVYAWKRAPVKQAIMACRSNMIDDAEAMLSAYQASQTGEKGQSAFIPAMTTAIAPIQTPPELDQVVGRASWLDVIVPTDTQGRMVQLRSMPAAFRCQIAFFCPDNHGAMMVANQFCLFWKHESKRTFPVTFELGYNDDGSKITDDWRFRVLDNSLYPDVALQDYKNLTVSTVDCTLVGAIPIIGGLDGEWDDVTDTGEQSDDGVGGLTDVRSPAPVGHTPIKGGRDPSDIAHSAKVAGLVVRQADVYDKADARHTRIEANPDTRVITQTELGD